MTLPRPRTLAGAVGLQMVLAEPDKAAVVVDFDGTLAAIVQRPEDARPVSGALDALSALCAKVAACAVVTGRAAGDAVSVGGLDAVRGLRVLGHYGVQEWFDGRLDSPEPSPDIDAVRPLLVDLVAAAPDGVHLEDKVHSLVVHTRPAGDPVSALDQLTGQVRGIAAEHGLEVVPGRLVVEVRPPGADKGFAVRRLVEEAGATVVLYVGDDLGDLPAYDAVDGLREQGVVGLTVASVGADAPSELAARADLVLDGPEAVVAFLADLAAALAAASP